MDRRTDGGDNNILFAFLKKRGDNNTIAQWRSFSVTVLLHVKKTLKILIYERELTYTRQ